MALLVPQTTSVLNPSVNSNSNFVGLGLQPPTDTPILGWVLLPDAPILGYRSAAADRRSNPAHTKGLWEWESRKALNTFPPVVLSSSFKQVAPLSVLTSN